MTRHATSLALAAVILVAGCGGGGGTFNPDGNTDTTPTK